MLDRACPNCGLDGRVVSAHDVAATLRSGAATWQDVLREDDVRLRPDPSTWSPLEYGCHVRDVCARFEARTRLMLTREDPDFENWDQDATAIGSRYGEQDPSVVAAELEAAARSFATLLDSVTGDQWQRTGRRSDGAQFTVDSFTRYFVHDFVHHLHDVGADSRGPA